MINDIFRQTFFRHSTLQITSYIHNCLLLQRSAVDIALGHLGEI